LSRIERHVQRTALLLHMVAPEGREDDNLLDDYEALSAEVEAFDPSLAARPKIVALNKTDLPDTIAAEPALRSELEKRGLELFLISAVTGKGIDKLKQRLGELVRERMKQLEDDVDEDSLEDPMTPE